jgi:hypothetical protein
MTHLDHAGHVCLPDGSVLRLDFELGRWVATFYRPDLSQRTCISGCLDEMRTVVAAWAAAALSTSPP